MIRRDVEIRCEPVLQLAVVLFVEGIAKVVDDAAEETLTDVPRGADALPLFFPALTLVGGRGIGDGRIVRCWFCWDGVRVDTCELVVLVGSEDVGKEAILFSVIPAPRMRDVLDFAREGRSFILEGLVVLACRAPMHSRERGGANRFMGSSFRLFRGGRHDNFLGSYVFLVD